MGKERLVILAIFASAQATQAQPIPADRVVYASQRILANIQNPEVVPGGVIAAPSKTAPNYFYIWVRDQALTFDGVRQWWKREPLGSARKHELEDWMWKHAELSAKLQQAALHAPANLGEPKFYVDGRVYDQGWLRPQNDGPALRALFFAAWAMDLGLGLGPVAGSGLTPELWPDFWSTSPLTQGAVDPRVRSLLLPIIRTDLDYVARVWNDPRDGEMWEMFHGRHFANQLFMATALVRGAELVERLGDPGAAQNYRMIASQIESALGRFWDPARGFIQVSRDGDGHWRTGLDSQVVLAALYMTPHRGAEQPFAVQDSRVEATARKLEEVFRGQYPINQRVGIPGIAIGRFAEDDYDGVHNGQSGVDGNAWSLITLAFGEYAYRRGEKDRGDAFLARANYHLGPKGELAEQWDRQTGFNRGAVDLTWSYVSLLRAAWARN